MKSKIIAMSLFGITAGIVGFYPLYQQTNALPQHTEAVDARHTAQAAKKIELVFALDTTGSMGGLIEAAKEKIWSIATNMAQAQSQPEIKIGLVAYRDRGDAYITKVVELSSDLDTVYSQLMDFKVNGGGDSPESVNQALYDAVHKIKWSEDQETYKAIFLVGDAPPHMDYPNEVQYPKSMTMAVRKGILVNTIQCGSDNQTKAQWRQIASLGQGDYFSVDQNGGAVAVVTPYDKELAKLSDELDSTRLYYGTPEELAKKKAKIDATAKVQEEASVASRARRATFNSSDSGKRNLLGEGDLVEDVKSGRVKLKDIDKDTLPASVAALPAPQQLKLIEETQEKRTEIKRQIQELADQRGDFIKKKLEKAGGAKGSLDEQLIGTLRKQASEKGLRYEGESIVY